MDITVQAILFDVDGTLIDTTAAVEAAWATWAGRHGVEVAEVLAICHGRRSLETVSHFLPESEVGAAATEVEDILFEAEPELISALPGSVDLLALPSGRWAAVTSGRGDGTRKRFGEVGLPLPRVIVAAEDVRSGKPDPEGYRAAAAALGLDARDCLVIEDAPAGIGAGRASGATVIAVATSHPAEELGDADEVIDDLTHLAVTIEGDVLRVRC